MEWTYNSNAIEGSTLTRQEMPVVLKYGLTVDGKSLVEHLAAINPIGGRGRASDSGHLPIGD